MDITKVVIPAAGHGTRFLPYTKAIPKEMLPLLNKPSIQWIVEEALQSAVHQFLVITARGKDQIADHFDVAPSLEQFLVERNKQNLLQETEKISRHAHFSYIRQSEALGLGHAVSLARHAINKEYFGIMLPDDIIHSPNNAGLAQLIRIARQEKASVIAIQEVPAEAVSSYGIIGIRKQISSSLFHVSHVVEKPQQKDAPSRLAIVGRYVLSHKVFASLDQIGTYAVGELQLTSAIDHMIKNNEKVFAYKIQGTRYDVGTPLGWMKAVMGLGLQDQHYGPHVKQLLAELYTSSLQERSSKNTLIEKSPIKDS